MKHIALTLALTTTITLIAGTVHASQPSPRFQLTFTPTAITNFDGPTLGGGLIGGALVIPFAKSGDNIGFMRIVGAGGILNRARTPVVFPTARGLVLIGATLKKRLILITGVGLAALFPETGPQVVPLGALGVGFWVIPGKLSVAFPTVVTSKNAVWNIEMAVTLPEPKRSPR